MIANQKRLSFPLPVGGNANIQQIYVPSNVIGTHFIPVYELRLLAFTFSATSKRFLQVFLLGDYHRNVSIGKTGPSKLINNITERGYFLLKQAQEACPK